MNPVLELVDLGTTFLILGVLILQWLRITMLRNHMSEIVYPLLKRAMREKEDA